MHWLQTLGHASQITPPLQNTQHDGQREDRRGQAEASRREEQQTQSQTIIHKIAWNLLLGIIIGEGRMRLA